MRGMASRAKALKIRGLSFGTLCDLENGKTVWDTSYASRVAAVLGVSTAEVWVGVMLNQSPPPHDAEAAVG